MPFLLNSIVQPEESPAGPIPDITAVSNLHRIPSSGCASEREPGFRLVSQNVGSQARRRRRQRCRHSATSVKRSPSWTRIAWPASPTRSLLLLLRVCASRSKTLLSNSQATQALSNALEFVNRNFEVDAERDYIMTVICEACTFQGSPTETIKVLEVKEAAFMCLGRIAELYYEKIA